MARYWVLTWILFDEPDVPLPTLGALQEEFDLATTEEQNLLRAAGEPPPPITIRVLEVRAAEEEP